MAVTEEKSTAEVLYQRHAAELTRFAASLVGPSDAADLVSIAFVGAMAGGALERADEPRAYLHRCVLNAARSSHRSSTRRTRRERATATTDELVPSDDTDPEVWAALGRLSERQRAVIYLTYWLDMTPDSIAEFLDLSAGSVKKHLDRGRSALRTTLGAQR